MSSTFVSVAEAEAALLESPSRDGSVKAVNTVGKGGLRGSAEKQRRRHAPTLSWDSLSDIALALPLTPWHATRHIFGQVVLVLTLAVKLWTYLGVGYKWTVALWRLVLYAMLLLPGFIQMIVFYFLSSRVIRSVPYGKGPRQRLDLYFPENYSKDQTYPVVIFVTGGAWTIGYKAWGALLARRLSSAGVLVACLDYRNFPQGCVTQMLEDINTGISWVCDKCARYQGDPDNVVLVGQSAGGQLSALALIMQAQQEAGSEVPHGASPAWNPKDLRAFVGVSGAYDLEGLAEHLHKRGLYKNMFRQIMSLDGVTALDMLSPVRAARAMEPGSAAVQLMPQVVLIHGTKDNSVPHSSSLQLHEALQRAGVDSTCRLIEGKTHTSFLLEGPMSGGRDLLMDIVLPLLEHPSPAEAVSEVDDALSVQQDVAAAQVAAQVVDVESPRDDVVPAPVVGEQGAMLGMGHAGATCRVEAGGCGSPGAWGGKALQVAGGVADGAGDSGVLCASTTSLLSGSSNESGPCASGMQRLRSRPQSYPALCPTVLCNLASMVCPF